MTQETVLDDTFKRNILSFSTLLARMPANVLERPFKGPLAVMEVVRVVRSVHSLQARLAVVAEGQVTMVDEMAASEDGQSLLLNGRPLPLAWAVFHRSGLVAFDHVLLGAEGGVMMLVADRSPLLDQNGVRLFSRHARLMAQSQEAIQDFFKELEGVAAMIRSGQKSMPFGVGGEGAGE